MWTVGPQGPTVQDPTVRTSGTHRQLLSYINHHHHRCTGGSSKWYSFRSKLLMPNVSSSSYHLIIILSSYSVSLSCRVGSGSLILMVATHIQPALLLHYSAPPILQYLCYYTAPSSTMPFHNIAIPISNPRATTQLQACLYTIPQ